LPPGEAAVLVDPISTRIAAAVPAAILADIFASGVCTPFESSMPIMISSGPGPLQG